MRTFAIRMGLLLSAAALLYLAPPADAQVPRPFRLQGAGALGFNPSDTLTGPFRASGLASNLGRWTNSGTLTFTTTGGLGITGGFGTVAFLASDGSVLTGSFTGQVLEVNGAVATISATFTWTGGTGRFAAASGGASGIVYQNVANGAFTFGLSGMLAY